MNTKILNIKLEYCKNKLRNINKITNMNDKNNQSIRNNTWGI